MNRAREKGKNTFIVVEGSPEKRHLSFRRNSFKYGRTIFISQIASSSPNTESCSGPSVSDSPLIFIFSFPKLQEEKSGKLTSTNVLFLLPI